MKILIIAICVVLWSGTGLSESEPQTTLTVLPTSDTSELGLAEPLQYALGQLLQSTGALKVQLSGYALSGFTAKDLAKAFDVLQSDLLSFTFMEKTRISVFLFSKERPRDFIVSFRGFEDMPGTGLTSDYIETKFRETVNDVLMGFNSGSYQRLPGAEPDIASQDEGETRQRAEQARDLFRELASRDEKNWYMLAGIGLARFAEPSANQSVTKSTLNFGGYAGTRLSESFSLEAGFDVYNYLLLHSDLRYKIEFLEKYINLSLSGGLGQVLASVTGASTDPSLTSPVGNTLLGPGISFDIPLLGAALRGEARYYLGSTSIFIATYGVIIAL